MAGAAAGAARSIEGDNISPPPPQQQCSEIGIFNAFENLYANKNEFCGRWSQFVMAEGHNI